MLVVLASQLRDAPQAVDSRELVRRPARCETERGDVGAPDQLELRLEAHPHVGMLRQHTDRSQRA